MEEGGKKRKDAWIVVRIVQSTSMCRMTFDIGSESSQYSEDLPDNKCLAAYDKNTFDIVKFFLTTFLHRKLTVLCVAVIALPTLTETGLLYCRRRRKHCAQLQTNMKVPDYLALGDTYHQQQQRSSRRRRSQWPQKIPGRWLQGQIGTGKERRIRTFLHTFI